MSTYGLNKLIRDINRSPAVREEYFKDQVSLLDRYALSVDERQALRSFDIGKLYRRSTDSLEATIPCNGNWRRPDRTPFCC